MNSYQSLMYVIKKRFIKNDIETCKICKFNYGNMYMYKSLPSDIAKNICKFNYNECNKCKKLRNIVGYVDKHNIEHIDRIIEVLNKKERIQINNNRSNNIFTYVNLIKFPTYGKIMERLKRLETHLSEFYDKEMHKELKTYYINLWKECKNKRPSIENYYNKLRFKYVQEFDDNIDKYNNSRQGLCIFIIRKFSHIERILNEIFDILTDCSLKIILDKSNIITLNVRFMLSKFTDVDKDGFHSNDFQQYLNKRFTHIKENTRSKREQYLNSTADFE